MGGTANNKKMKSVRDATVEKLYTTISNYSDWYEQHGLHLPSTYATDPTEWTIALQKMKRAFKILHDESQEKGELWEAKNKWRQFNEEDTEEIRLLDKEIKEGFALFGKHLSEMIDPYKGVEPGH